MNLLFQSCRSESQARLETEANLFILVSTDSMFAEFWELVPGKHQVGGWLWSVSVVQAELTGMFLMPCKNGESPSYRESRGEKGY